MAEEIAKMDSVSKTFGDKKILEKISFSVGKAEILGMLGPNGAGKTTALRIFMGIMNSDSGNVRIFSKPFSEKTKESIGYLPEERGLYKTGRILETLVYLASLKGMDGGKAEQRARALLSEVGLSEYANSQISELSKGMGQKVQFISSIIHKPKLLVLDEPFSGFDPINLQLIKRMILKLKEEGTAVILSTHQMEHMEKMCDRIIMIDRGKQVLYGDLKSIKSKFGKNTITVSYNGKLPKTIEGVMEINDSGNYAELKIGKGISPNSILKQLINEVEINAFELKEPSLEEIFVEVASR